MSNPWLGVPLEDYEGHMNSAEVQQLGALAELFAEALERCSPSSVAVLGVAGGNGLDRIDTNVTRRVVGVDINQRYLDEVRRRFAGLPGLELHCLDLAAEPMEVQPVALVHAALVFEHAGVGLCLDNAVALVDVGGAMAVVLQLPSDVAQGVGASPFASLQMLKMNFKMIDPGWLERTLEERGFRLVTQDQRALTAGKSFWMGVFESRLGR